MTIKMNKKDIVYQELKKKIISNEIPPGSSIHEADFANMLGVSKIPIREALRQLENDGLVENISGRGTKVCEITIKNIRETFEIREIIECGVTGTSSSRVWRRQLGGSFILFTRVRGDCGGTR